MLVNAVEEVIVFKDLAYTHVRKSIKCTITGIDVAVVVADNKKIYMEI